MPYTPPPNTPPNAGMAFFAGQDQAEEQQLRRLQMRGVLNSLSQTVKHQQDQEAFRNEIAALGPNAPTEAVMKVAGKYANPQSLLELHTRNQDREAQRNQQALQFAQSLDQKQQALALQRQQAIDRTQDQAERRRIEEWYKAESLKNQQTMAQLNTQLRAMGIEVTRQGQQLQLQRFDADQRERRDRAVTGFANELQQNKLPALSASLGTANDLLRQYEDKDIPGMGLFIGSKNIPNWMRSEDANKTRSAVQAVSNDLLNLYSGLAVTLPEAERRELEEMRGGSFDDKDFRNAWPRIVKRYNTVVGNLRAGQNAEVLREYQSRPGAISLNPIVPAFGNLRPQGAGPAGVPPPPPGFNVVAP